MKTALDDRMSVGFSRAVTRRTFLQKTMRWGVVAGGTLAGVVYRSRPAAAASCQPGGAVSDWGCYCAGTIPCGSDRCTSPGNTCTGGAEPRCTYWSSPYCWCSLNCCIKPIYGRFSCCDCWKYGDNGSCLSGNTRCICKFRVTVSTC